MATQSATDFASATWQHPLIRPLSRRRLLVSSLAGAGTIALSTALGSGVAGAAQTDATPSASPSVAPSATGDQDAVALLTTASRAMAALKTFHFEIETLSGGDTSIGINLESVVGDVRRPLDFQAEIKAKLPIGSITVRAVGINGEFSIQDPLSADGSWMSLGADNQLFALVNPDIILLLAVQALQDAKIGGQEKLNGVQTTLVTGTIDFQNLASTIGNGNNADQLKSQLATAPLGVMIWIDGDSRVQAIELDGALLAIDSSSSSRMISFSNFDEPVDITPPS
ncbi:MAG: LppX_LprAFG lipoprotein [Thermomicrobiales bacterium]